ncbi:helix-turn-helix transcriptional regulator [Lewinella sp. W8]|uniref:ArsR/SmtB family transcription factor n=1 Tax=Lewinella sp. W8 TaxID=2528208 RepID=UPI001068A352|nr:winged helix-turn-helix transcriptional regulator [Lewinella sp. W8]MTB51803.1 hypothetical protein [Lewinella sp. W8]
MAKSKSIAFSAEFQQLATLGHALAHPARVIMVKRLREGATNYNGLVGGIPLTRPTLQQHLNLLDRLGFIEHVLLPSGKSGYQLNEEAFTVASDSLDLIIPDGERIGGIY